MSQLVNKIWINNGGNYSFSKIVWRYWHLFVAWRSQINFQGRLNDSLANISIILCSSCQPYLQMHSNESYPLKICICYSDYFAGRHRDIISFQSNLISSVKGLTFHKILFSILLKISSWMSVWSLMHTALSYTLGRGKAFSKKYFE